MSFGGEISKKGANLRSHRQILKVHRFVYVCMVVSVEKV